MSALDPTKFQNAFPGCRPLGVSYSLGQGILHGDIPPSPSDPSIPDDDHLVDFGEAVEGSIYDREGWTEQTYANKLSELKARQDVRDAYAAYLRNGPIPTDTEMDGAVDDVWDKADRIIKTRHIYFYDDMSNYGNTMAHGVVYGMGAGSALYLQIQGYSDSAGAWALPKKSGTTVKAWRQDFGSGAGHWKEVFSAGDWVGEHHDSIMQAFTYVFLAAVTFMTGGLAATLVPVLVGTLGLTAATAVSSATFLTGAVVGGAKWLLTGDSSQFVNGMITSAAEIPSNMSQADAEGLATKFPGTAAFVKGIGNTFKQVGEQIAKYPEIQALVTAGDSIGAYLKSAQNIATGIPIIDKAYYKAARDGLGGLYSVGGAFFERTKAAVSAEAIKEIHDLVPWYAKGYVIYAGTGRAAEIAQQDAAQAAQAKADAHFKSSVMLLPQWKLDEQAKARASARGVMLANPAAASAIKAIAASDKAYIKPIIAANAASEEVSNATKAKWLGAASVALGLGTMYLYFFHRRR